MKHFCQMILLTALIFPARAQVQTQPAFCDADYARHVSTLKKKLSSAFTIVVQKPFVVVGDESPAKVKARAVGTVKWATTHLRASYFSRNPRHIVTVWLFKNKHSYLKHNKKFFNEADPGTPFGYYSSRHRALVMNIATGGGTLVHEMVHAFMENNFSRCPAWFNEGLASLYEQCGTRKGKIWGLTNWRLSGLKQAIQKNRVPSFKQLIRTSSHAFYQEDPGTNYAQARYLCYYLQEKGLLRKYYRAFKKSVDQDPTGYKTLMKVLGESDMAAFKKRWEGHVMKLRYR